MKRQVITPANKEEWLKERLKDITSTEMSALFGISPYETEFELWHKKKNQELTLIEENDRMKWGSRLESSIAKGLAEDEGWEIRKKDEYIRLLDIRAGASFDFEILPGDRLFEIKNVDALMFKEGWEMDESGNIEAPLHIELQVQAQLFVSGAKSAIIGALIGGNRVVKIEREPDEGIFARMEEKVFNFWRSIEKNKPPEPNFIKDAEFISKLYKRANDGEVLDITGNSEIENLATLYSGFAAQEKAAREQKQALKAEMLMKLGRASKAIGQGFSISCGETKKTEVPAHTRESYRNFKIYWKK